MIDDPAAARARVLGGMVFQETLRLINRQALSADANRALLPVLEAGRRRGPLALFHLAGLEAGLDLSLTTKRAAALYCGYCAGNLCDDLIDGDCTYIAEPFRVGPAAQYVLQNLMMKGLLAAGVSPAAVEAGAAEFARSASWVFLELDTRQWTADRYREVAEGIAGRQWAAHLSLLWWNTPLESKAPLIGRGVAIANHVAEDLRSEDPRLLSLGVSERRDIARWALELSSSVRAESVQCMNATLDGIRPILEAAA